MPQGPSTSLTNPVSTPQPSSACRSLHGRREWCNHAPLLEICVLHCLWPLNVCPIGHAAKGWKVAAVWHYDVRVVSLHGRLGIAPNLRH